jgi:hypothetical protein
VPVLIDGDLNVVARHGRLLARKDLGWTEVPAIRIDHLTEAQKRAFMIADNRLTEVATWDDDLLAEQLRELADLDLNFDIEATGFDMGEIDFRIESARTGATQGAEPTIPAVRGPPVSQISDIWLIGRHEVTCGDSFDNSSFASLMGPQKAAVVFTDPPYNVPIDGHVSGLGQIRHRDFPMAVGEMCPDSFTKSLATVFAKRARHSRPGSLHFVCMDWRT